MRNQEKGKNLSRAVALRYTPKEDRAPKVTAKGSGPVAEKIIALAKEHGIPIQEDRALVQVLSQLDFYEEIPPSIYGLVAEILAQAFALEDSPNAIRAARQAGWFCVAVPNHITRQMDTTHADLHLGALSDLPLEALIARIEGLQTPA